MVYKDAEAIGSYWNDDANLQTMSRGKYITLNGNTGVGKSSIISRVRELSDSKIRLMSINERILHHPLLKLMFAKPKEYAFVIQLNFLLQRHIILYRWLSIGYSVIIERSHIDDRLFAKHHYESGHINNDDYNLYLQLADKLDKMVPEPDLYFFMECAPEISIARINEAEALGERPKEFPDEATKYSFAYSWYTKYRNWYENLVAQQENNSKYLNTTFRKVNADDDVEKNAQIVYEFLIS